MAKTSKGHSWYFGKGAEDGGDDDETTEFTILSFSPFLFLSFFFPFAIGIRKWQAILASSRQICYWFGVGSLSKEAGRPKR